MNKEYGCNHSLHIDSHGKRHNHTCAQPGHQLQCAHADFPMSLPGTSCSNCRVHHCRKIESRMRIRIRIRIRMPPSHLSWAALPQGRAPAPAAPQRSRAGLPKTCRWNRKNPSHMKKNFALAREPIFRFVVALLRWYV